MKIGFATERDIFAGKAKQKPAIKDLEMIVVNDTDLTIGATTSAASILTSDGQRTSLPTVSKEALAAVIVETTAPILACKKLDAS